MNSPSLFLTWLQLLALLAVELALIALALALLVRWGPTAAWRRTFCQAAIIAVLALTACELSGSARTLQAWAAGKMTGWHNTAAPERSALADSTPVLNRAFRSEVEARLAARGETAPKRAVDRISLILSPAAGSNFLHGQIPLTPALSPGERGNNGQALRGTSATKSHDGSWTESDARQDFSTRTTDSRKVATTEAASVDLLWLGLLWLSGSAVVAARAGFAHCALVLFGWRRRAVSDPALFRRVGTLAQALKLTRRVRLIESARLSGPIAFGLMRPTIGLPQDFSSRFDPTRQEAMLAHELAHLAAHDPLWCLLADLATAVLWWHPAVWWVRRQLHLAGELAADEASLLVNDGPRALAECLVELGARLAGPPPLGQLRISGFRSHLGRRVQQLVRLEGRAWAPPHRLRTRLIRIFGPMAMTAIVILCTAWAAPRALTKGNSMKTMQLNWKRSLASFALLAAVGNPDLSASAADSGKTGAAPSTAAEVTQPAGVVSARAASGSAPDGTELRARYGLSSATASTQPSALVRASRPGAGKDNPGRDQIEAKLREMVLPEVKFDGLPLEEVVRFLSDQCRKLDPEKRGVNFMLNNNTPNQPPAAPGAIDPTTGLPGAFAPAEAIDVSQVTIKFSLPLWNITMKDLLEAVCKVADRPVEYTIEDYAVVFSPRPEAIPPQPVSARATPLSERPLLIRTYKVDTNTFFAGLENAFGIKRESSAKDDSKARSHTIQAALRDLLTQLGISMEPGKNKAIFYNDLTGVVMVRATPEDQEIVGAAIATLGGELMGVSFGGGGGA